MSVEGELGTIGQTGNSVEGGVLKVTYTDPAQAQNFVTRTVVDTLADASQDIVFARALIQHFDPPHPFLHEAWRILAPGGPLLIQDQTPEDVFLPGSLNHMRGWFFDLFPQLAAFERERRPARAAIEAALTAVGFELRPTTTLWETRREYADSAALAADLRGRTWRSILHELSDEALAQMIDYILARLPAGQPIVENDRWTFWWAQKPGVAGHMAISPALAQ